MWEKHNKEPHSDIYHPKTVNFSCFNIGFYRNLHRYFRKFKK